MPVKGFKAKDAMTPAEEFKEFAEYIYGGKCLIESQSEGEAQFYIDVPGDMKREEFESDMKEWCEEHGCDYELIDQAPQAPSPQYFSENTKLMYPRMKSYEKLAQDERKLELAKKLFKASWGAEFDPEDPDDQEDIVILYNMYMDELSEWKPVVLKMRFNKEETL